MGSIHAPSSTSLLYLFMPMTLSFYPSLFCLWLAVHLVQGQDPQFSQNDAAPLHINPAYAGYAGDVRANVAYRNQWRDLGSYNTTSASVDVGRECGSQFMGGGIYVMHDAQNASVQTVSGGVVFVPAVFRNRKETFSARMGFYAGGGQRTYKVNQGVFMDQLTGQPTLNPSQDPLALAPLSKNFFDVGFGGLVEFNHAENDQDWIGVSVYHLNQPNVAVGFENYRLPMRIGVQAGSKLEFGRWNITPVANFRMQSRIYQLDISTYFQYSSLTLGLMYRGIPLSKTLVNQITQDALVGIVGLQAGNFSVGLSYDVTISKLYNYTGNTFEITTRYLFPESMWRCEGGGKKSSGKKGPRCPMYK